MNPGLIEDIEQQIDHTRHALDRTISALLWELSPRHQLEQAWRSAKFRTGRSVRAGADWARANPASIALGACVLVAAAVGAIVYQRRRR